MSPLVEVTSESAASRPDEGRWLRCELLPPEIRIQESDSTSCPEWDRRLQSSPLGHFQQSTAWARVKALEGWRARRWLVRTVDSGELVGGFQLLWTYRGPLRVGFLSKAPVLFDPARLAWRQLLELVPRAAARAGLSALVSQLPDNAVPEPADLPLLGPQPHRNLGVISATVLVDLTPSFAEVSRRFSRSTAKQVRRAAGSDLEFRWAEASGADAFHRLLVETCRRHGVAPNPAHSASLAALLREFGPLSAATAGAGILEAWSGGTRIAGTLLVRFGNRLTGWKKGWSGAAPDLHPAKAITARALQWGCEHGCATYDFVSVSRRLAEEWSRPDRDAALAPSGIDAYKLQFGGSPRLLHPPRLWLRPSPVRFAYGIALRLTGRHR